MCLREDLKKNCKGSLESLLIHLISTDGDSTQPMVVGLMPQFIDGLAHTLTDHSYTSGDYNSPTYEAVIAGAKRARLGALCVDRCA